MAPKSHRCPQRIAKGAAGGTLAKGIDIKSATYLKYHLHVAGICSQYENILYGISFILSHNKSFNTVDLLIALGLYFSHIIDPDERALVKSPLIRVFIV